MNHHMTWFEELTGFPETSADDVRAKLVLDGGTLTSRVNGRSFLCGRLETPSLGELRERVARIAPASGRLSAREVLADVGKLHADPSNAGALFQVASQFNLLEMAGPDATPERGVGIYENDHTQGPACAVAAGAGTIFRNYFAPVRGRVGQTSDNQIDCLSDLGDALGNSGERLWTMRNGYALATRAGLAEISRMVGSMSPEERERLKGLLRIGIQWNTQVTIRGGRHTVTQAYCSALPVGYGVHPADLWEPFARLVLEATYEATMCAAALNASETGNACVFLTLVGGGVFENRSEWITESCEHALRFCEGRDLDVAIVSRRFPNPDVARLVRRVPRSQSLSLSREIERDAGK